MSTIRRIAASTTLALAVSGLGVVSAQPASAADGTTLTWSFSDYLFNPNKLPIGFTSHAVADGATETATGIVFNGSDVTGSLAGGDLRATYAGSVDFTWHATIGFANPEVVVDGDEGRIVADVSWSVPETGAVDDVVLTTFDPATATVDGDGFTVVPDWSTGSWAPDLLAALPDSVDAFFQATGSSSDARKAPAAFTAATAAGPQVAATTAYAGNAVTVEVSGTGFDGGTPPVDDGVYIALAPAGAFPETDDFEDQEKVASTKWVPAAQMLDGTFTVTLDPENRYLDPRTSYSVYTWQAHSHSNPSQDTETPVTIDFSKLGTAAKLKAVKKGKNLVVTVGGATAAGKVALKLTKGKVTKKASAQVKKGAATVKLPALTKGRWRTVVTYTSTNAAYRSATKTVTITS